MATHRVETSKWGALFIRLSYWTLPIQMDYPIVSWEHCSPNPDSMHSLIGGIGCQIGTTCL
jgi:hypothetical protein